MDDRVSITRQNFCLLALFALGSAVVLAPGRAAGRDMWLAAMVALLMAAPLALLFGRLVQLTNGASFFTAQIELLGPFFGRVTAALYVLYSLHLGALVIRNFTEYIQTVSFPYEPQYIFALPLGVLCLWSIRAGIDTLKRWTVLILPFTTLLILIIIFISSGLWDVKNLTPILYNGFQPVLKAAAGIVAFPFMETILLCFLIKKPSNQKSAIWIYLAGFAFTAVLLALVFARNVIVLSYEQATKFQFPSYETVSLINIGDFIQGIQAIMVVIFLFGGYVKTTVCMYVAAEGTARLCGQHYRKMAAPVGLIMVTFSLFAAKNIVDMIEFANKYYMYYVLPFGFFLPLILWIVAEWKHHRQKASEAASGGGDPAVIPGDVPPEQPK